MTVQIPIFFTFDNNYVIPACVAFYSLLQRAKDEVFYEMYVLHSDITEENQKQLLDIVKRFKNAKLNFINTDDFLKDCWNKGNFDNNNNGRQFTYDAIVRCFGAKFFPKLDKIIYSDVDCVFMDDISELWNIDLHDKYIGAVKNAFMKYNKNELSHLKNEHYEMLKDSYFAGGIWVLNLKKIREDNLEKRMLEIVNDNTIVKRWNDQDIMNIACQNKVHFIPLNYISYPYLRKVMENKNFISHYSKDELYDSIINPKILHYAASKPWNTDIKYSEIWWNIYDYLGLADSSIIKRIDHDKTNKKIKKYKFLYNLFLFVSIILLVLVIVGIGVIIGIK